MANLYHPRTAAALAAAALAPGGIMLYGPEGTGRRLAALDLAIRLNCPAGGDDCATCRKLRSGNHPDFIERGPAEGKASFSIEQVRQLVSELSLRPYSPTGARLIVLHEAETLTPQAQNALLKSLEEPPAGTRFVLITTSLEALLPTVRSRLMPVYFAPVPTDQLAAWLEASHGHKPSEAARLAAAAGGNVGRAVTLAANPGLMAAQAEAEAMSLRLLSSSKLARLTAARELAAGKATPPMAVLAHLQAHTTSQLAAGGTADTARRRLAAIAAARRMLAASVTSRVIYDRLGLEL